MALEALSTMDAMATIAVAIADDDQAIINVSKAIAEAVAGATAIEAIATTIKTVMATIVTAIEAAVSREPVNRESAIPVEVIIAHRLYTSLNV